MQTDTKKFLEELAQVNTDASLGDVPDEEETSEGQLTLDVYQTQAAIIVEAPIAGVRGEDLEVSITDDSVTIRGHRERMYAVREADFLYQECHWGSFSRSVMLPEEVEPQKAEATIQSGVLRIIMPKLSK